jgi:hypothetical protein
MSWSKARDVLEKTKTASGYELAQLARADVPQTTESLRRWFPDIQVGAESCHLSPDFYYDHAALAGGDDERPIFPVVAKAGPDLAAMMTFERNVSSRTITCRVGAVAPEHRGSGLALLGPMLLEKIGRALGDELAFYFATLKTLHQQVLAERMRYQLVGIVPAFDRSMIRAGEVKRVYEAMYAKVLVSEEAIAPPPDEALTVRTKLVWQALFGSPRGDEGR